MMKAKSNIPANIDEYILAFPKSTQILLEQVRSTIKKVAPKAEEIISYGMPAFKLNGVLVYFAGYKNHIGFYPLRSGIETFKKEIAIYKWSKGAIQFPMDKKMPTALISKIVKFRLKENLEKSKAKKRI